MSPSRPSQIAPADAEELLRSFGRDGDRGRALRAQLRERFPNRSVDDIEDAVQGACESFLREGDGIADAGQAYAWLRTAAYHLLLREVRRRERVVPVDPVDGGLEERPAGRPGPAEELIALEDEADLGGLVREVAASLSEDRARILALWGAGHRRPEIAARLGLSERAVKRAIEEIMQEARVALARQAGGGCGRFESAVLRMACGLAAAGEAEQAQAHLHHCGRCAAFARRLEAWRDKAGALLPVPAAVEGASPGLVERAAHRLTDGLASVRRQVLGGGGQAGRQAAGATYAKAVDPTPFAAIRPGAVVAVVAGCLAVGGGTYCARHGVDPIEAAAGLLSGTQEAGSSSPQPAGGPTEPAAVVPPPAPVVEEAPASAAPETTYTPEPKPEPEPQPEPEPAPEPEPEPEASFEPTAPVTATPGEEAVAEPATESAPAVKARPAPAPSGDAPQFGGP